MAEEKVLESHVGDLYQLVDQRDSYVDPVTCIGSIARAATLIRPEQACSILFRSTQPPDVLAFLRRSVDSAVVEDSILRDARVKLLDMLSSYFSTIEVNVILPHAHAISTTCVDVYRRDANNTAKAAAVRALTKLFKKRYRFPEASSGVLVSPTKPDNEDEEPSDTNRGESEDVKEMYEGEEEDSLGLVSLFLNEVMFNSKLTQTARGSIFRLLGQFMMIFPTAMGENAQRLLDIIKVSLNKQFNSKKPEMLVVTGCFKCLTLGLYHKEYRQMFYSINEGHNPTELNKQIYQWMETTIRTGSQKSLTRYAVAKSAIELLSHHAALFRDSFAKNAKEVYELLEQCCSSETKPLKKYSFIALENVVYNIAAYLNEKGPDAGSKKIFTFFLKRFLGDLTNEECPPIRFELSINGIGALALCMSKYLPPDNVPKIADKLFELCSQLAGADQLDLATVGSDDHEGGGGGGGNGNAKPSAFGSQRTFRRLLAFLNAIGRVLNQLPDNYLSLGHTATLNRILSFAAKGYYRLLGLDRSLLSKSLMTVFLALINKSSTIEEILPAFVAEALMKTLDVVDESETFVQIFDPATGLPDNRLLFEYERLWLDLLSKKWKYKLSGLVEKSEEAVNRFAGLLVDALVSQILRVQRQLNLSYRPIDEEAEIAGEVSKLEPLVPEDQETFLNLTVFCERVLTKIPYDLFEKWIPLYCRELIQRSDALPLISGFYRLMAIAMKLASQGGYFQTTIGIKAADSDTLSNSVDAQNSSLRQIRRYLEDTLSRMEQFRDELLAAALEFILNVPFALVDLERMVPAVTLALDTGISYLPTAEVAIGALERWNEWMPMALRPHLPSLLIPLNPYLQGSSNDAGSSGGSNVTAVLGGPSGRASVPGVSRVRGRRTKANSTPKLEEDGGSAFAQLQKRILRFLGSLGGEESMQILGNYEDALCESVAWDTKQRIKLSLPLSNQVVDIYLDHLLPRVLMLAEDKSDRQTKTAAAELLHAIVIFLVGRTATSPTYQGSQGETPQQATSEYANIWRKVFPTLLRLATDAEQVTRQLYSQLINQMIHWLSSSSRTAAEANLLLDALCNGFENSFDGALRDVCADGLAEFLRYAVKQSTKKQMADNPLGPAFVFERLITIARHPLPNFRIGAALAFNKLYRYYREESSLVSDFSIDLLRHFLFAMKLCHQTKHQHKSMQAASDAVDHLSKIICRRAELFQEKKSTRAGDIQTMLELVDWLFEQIGRKETSYRVKCISLLGLFTNHLDPSSGKSTAHPTVSWIRSHIQERGRKDIFNLIEMDCVTRSPWILEQTVTPTSILSWMEFLYACVDSLTWLVHLANESNGALSPLALLAEERTAAEKKRSRTASKGTSIEKSKALDQISHFLTDYCRPSAELVKDGNGRKEWLRASEEVRIQPLRTSILKRIFHLVTEIVSNKQDGWDAIRAFLFGDESENNGQITLRSLVTAVLRSILEPKELGLTHGHQEDLHLFFAANRLLKILIHRYGLDTIRIQSVDLVERVLPEVLTSLPHDPSELMIRKSLLKGTHWMVENRLLDDSICQRVAGMDISDLAGTVGSAVVDLVCGKVQGVRNKNNSKPSKGMPVSPILQEQLAILLNYASMLGWKAVGEHQRSILKCILEDLPGKSEEIEDSGRHFYGLFQTSLTDILIQDGVWNTAFPELLSPLVLRLQHQNSSTSTGVEPVVVLRDCVVRALALTEIAAVGTSSMGHRWTVENFLGVVASGADKLCSLVGEEQPMAARAADSGSLALSIFEILVPLFKMSNMLDRGTSTAAGSSKKASTLETVQRLREVGGRLVGTLLGEQTSTIPRPIAVKAKAMQIIAYLVPPFGARPETFEQNLMDQCVGALQSVAVEHFPLNLESTTNLPPEDFARFSLLFHCMLDLFGTGNNVELLRPLFQSLSLPSPHVFEEDIEKSFGSFVAAISTLAEQEKTEHILSVVRWTIKYLFDDFTQPSLKSRLIQQLAIPLLMRSSVKGAIAFFTESFTFGDGTQSQTNCIKKIVDTVVAPAPQPSASDREVEQKLTVRELCFQLLTCLYRTIPADVIRGPITKGYTGTLQAKGTELTSTICKAARASVIGELFGSSQAAIRVARSAFVCLARVVCATQTKEKIFEGLLFAPNISKGASKEDRVWDHLVDPSENFVLSVETPQYRTVLFSKKGEAFAPLIQRPKNKSYLSSQLSLRTVTQEAPSLLLSQAQDGGEEADKPTWNESERRLGAKEDSSPSEGKDGDVIDESLLAALPADEISELEIDPINQNPAMPALLLVIDTMSALFHDEWQNNQTTQVMGWMKSVLDSLADPSTHPNVKLFLLKLILNRPAPFLKYPDKLLDIVVNAMLKIEGVHGISRGFHYFLKDVCELLITLCKTVDESESGATSRTKSSRWAESAPVKTLVNHLLRVSSHTKAYVMRDNLDVVKRLLEAFHGQVSIQMAVIIDMLETSLQEVNNDSAEYRVRRLCGIHLVDALLVNGYDLAQTALRPGDEALMMEMEEESTVTQGQPTPLSMERIRDALVANVKAQSSLLYEPASEVIGLLLELTAPTNGSSSLSKDCIQCAQEIEASIRDFLRKQFSRDHNRYLRIVERICHQRPSFADKDVILKILSCLPSISTNAGLSVMAIHILAVGRHSYGSHELFTAMQSVFPKFFGHRQEGVQLAVLDLLLTLGSDLTGHQLMWLFQLSVGSATGGSVAQSFASIFSAHTNEECRAKFYHFCISSYESQALTYSAKKSRSKTELTDTQMSTLVARLSNVLVEGLGDSSKEIRSLLLNFWDPQAFALAQTLTIQVSSKLPEDPLERVLALLKSPSNSSEQRPTLSSPKLLLYAGQLLLCLGKKAEQYDRYLFDRPLSDCLFEDMNIDTSWQRKADAMIPLFASQSQNLRAFYGSQSQFGSGGVETQSVDLTQKPLGFLRATQDLAWTQTQNFGGAGLAGQSYFSTLSQALSTSDGYGQTQSKLLFSMGKRNDTTKLSAQAGAATQDAQLMPPPGSQIIGRRRHHRFFRQEDKSRFGLSQATSSFDTNERGESTSSGTGAGTSSGSSTERGGYSSRSRSGHFAIQAMKARRLRQAVSKQQRDAKDKRIVLYRKYRAGELPDIQIRMKDMVDPLIALCGLDSITSRMVFVTLFGALTGKVGLPKESAQNNSSVEEKLQSISHSVVSLMQSEAASDFSTTKEGKSAKSKEAAGELACLREPLGPEAQTILLRSCLALFQSLSLGSWKSKQDKYSLEVDPSAVMASAVSSTWNYYDGIAVLEEYAVNKCYSEESQQVGKADNSRSGGGRRASRPSQKDTSSPDEKLSYPLVKAVGLTSSMCHDLALLYERIGESEVSSCLLEKYIEDSQDVRKALMAQMDGDDADAIKYFNAVLPSFQKNEESESNEGSAPPSSTPPTMYMLGTLDSMRRVMQWKDIRKVISNSLPRDTSSLMWEVSDYVLSSSFVKNYLVSNLHCWSEETKDDTMDFIENSFQNAKRREELETKHAHLLAMALLAAGDDGRARAQVDNFYSTLLREWGNLHPLASVLRARHLLNLQLVCEMDDFLTMKEKWMAIAGSLLTPQSTSEGSEGGGAFKKQQILTNLGLQLLQRWGKRAPKHAMSTQGIAILSDIMKNREFCLQRFQDDLLKGSKGDDVVENKQSSSSAAAGARILPEIWKLEASMWLRAADTAIEANCLDVSLRYIRSVGEATKKLKKIDTTGDATLITLESNFEKYKTIASYRLKAAHRELARMRRAGTDSDGKGGIKRAKGHFQAAFDVFEMKEVVDILAKVAPSAQTISLLATKARTHEEFADFLSSDGVSASDNEEELQKHLQSAFKVYGDVVTAARVAHEYNGSIDAEQAGDISLRFTEFCDTLLRRHLSHRATSNKGHKETKSHAGAVGDDKINMLASSGSEAETVNSLGLRILTGILSSLKFGNQRAQLYFPRVLDLLSSLEFTRSAFLDRITDLPPASYLRWTPQMMALIKQPEGPAVIKALELLAQAYPKALFYEFSITAENFDASDHARTQGLHRLLNDVVMKSWMEALRGLHHPEIRLMEGLKEIHTALRQGDTTKAKGIYKELVGDTLSTSRPTIQARIGAYNKKFASKAGPKIMSILGREGEKITEAALKEAQKFSESLRAQLRGSARSETAIDLRGRSKLSDLSEWMASFDPSESTLEIPGQYEKLRQREPRPELHVLVNSFDSSLLTLNSKQKPKRLVVYGSDGGKYMFLVKGGEDLRLDQRIQQLFAVMNDLLESSITCQSRGLKNKTYSVIPMSTRIGVLEWLKNTAPLKAVIEDEWSTAVGSRVDLNQSAPMQLYHKALSQYKDYEKFNAGMKRDGMIGLFEELLQASPPDLLRRRIMRMGTSAESFLSLRSRFAKCVSTLCASGYILGIGDRHLENFLLDMEDGSLVGIDFGLSFGNGASLLPVPELIPFRLTRQFTFITEPLGTDILIKPDIVRIMKALQENRAPLMLVAEVFVKEPLLDWRRPAAKKKGKGAIATTSAAASSSSAEAASSESLASSNYEVDENSDNAYAMQKIALLHNKLERRNPIHILCSELEQNRNLRSASALKIQQDVVRGEKGKDGRAALDAAICPTTEEQVDILVELATDPHLLTRQWRGLQLWI